MRSADRDNPDFSPLRESLARLGDHPGPEARALFLHGVLEFSEAHCGTLKARRRLRDWLRPRVAWLPDKPDSFKRQFNRLATAWQTRGRTPAALLDGRKPANQKRAKPSLHQADKDLIVGKAVLGCGGRLSQALRELRREGRLSNELEARFLSNPSRKDYVPRALRRELQPEVNLLRDWRRGPREARLNGATIDRDWSGVHAGDWYQADDFTLPVYYYVPTEDGWFELTRGQALIMVDVRSKKILDFVLIDAKHYDSIRIRVLFNKVMDRFGLPREGFYLENGIWKSSRLLVGERRATRYDAKEVEWDHLELGLRSLGLQFMHAGTPGAKIVENIGGLIQNRMEGEPGYVGRNEITDKFERVQKAKLDVEARRTHPARAGFLSADEWFARLHTLFEDYNAEPQDSKLTFGLSPEDAWRRFQHRDNPLVRLDTTTRYLFATHVKKVRVSKQGAQFKIGRKTYRYETCNTPWLKGQEVLLWFMPETPETAVLTDLDKANPVAVPFAASVGVPAMSGPDPAATASVNRQNSYAKARYSQVKAAFIPPCRPTLPDAETARLGHEIEKQTEALKEEQKALRRRRASVGRAAKRVGLSSSAVREDANAERLRDLAEWLDE